MITWAVGREYLYAFYSAFRVTVPVIYYDSVASNAAG